MQKLKQMLSSLEKEQPNLEEALRYSAEKSPLSLSYTYESHPDAPPYGQKNQFVIITKYATCTGANLYGRLTYFFQENQGIIA